jgi:heme/copper-type cytochrome/quinol oxidase subunit 2
MLTSAAISFSTMMAIIAVVWALFAVLCLAIIVFYRRRQNRRGREILAKPDPTVSEIGRVPFEVVAKDPGAFAKVIKTIERSDKS